MESMDESKEQLKRIVPKTVESLEEAQAHYKAILATGLLDDSPNFSDLPSAIERNYKKHRELNVPMNIEFPLFTSGSNPHIEVVFSAGKISFRFCCFVNEEEKE